MLNDFSWDMTGYMPKHAVNPHGDGIIPYAAERIFQLEPEPPKVGSLNEYILSALQEITKWCGQWLGCTTIPRDAVNEFSKKYNCDLALAEEYLKVVRGIRNQQPFYVTDENGEETGEDVALDDSWNYTDILWNGIQAEKGAAGI